ncbi:hypothetical protein ABT124_15675 [Streptomyces sp. NPDC001982]|uniref:hypothetical protein n=1 Tax=Streptomyces sp. NPDC001982 TaxID=3154405 RepID=UPI003329699F
MAGVGKTQLAVQHAGHLWGHGELDLLVWASADTAEAVVDAYAQAGAELLGKDLSDPQRSADAFLAWLAASPAVVFDGRDGQARPCRWLVVLDNVSSPTDLRGLWPPSNPHGRTLVTTRNRDSAFTDHGRHRIDVAVFNESEAAAYLSAKLLPHRRVDSADQIHTLAQDLGGLPVALSQAASFMVNRHISCADYRSRMADHGRIPQTMANLSGLPDEQRQGLAALAQSVDLADGLHPQGLARPMLKLAAQLDSCGIPISVLTSPPALTYLAKHRGTLPMRLAPRKRSRQKETSAQEAEDALWNLHQLSLIDYTPTNPHRAVRIHPLCQSAFRAPFTFPAPHEVRVHQRLQQETRKLRAAWQSDLLAETAADALVAVWRSEPAQDPDLDEALRANATALVRYADSALRKTSLPVLLYFLGDSLGASGQISAAVAHWQHLADTSAESDYHPHTYRVLRALAYWRGEAGDAAGAAAAYADLVERTESYRRDTREALAERDELAHWQGEAGDAASAVATYVKLLSDRERVLGPDDPDTVATRRKLAHWRSRTDGGDKIIP